MFNLIDILSRYTGFNEDEVNSIIAKAPTTYKKYSIKKRRGGTRTIYHPSKETKTLQYVLLNYYLNAFPVHKCAYAYIKGNKSPLLNNALKHKDYKYSICLDIKDFFPSIKPDDLLNILTEKNSFTKEEKQHLINLLFISQKNGMPSLPIGAPTSPMISNIIMYDLDNKINGLAHKINKRSVYTRYADDLVFSTNTKGACLNFYKNLESLLTKTKSPKLTINKLKTNLCSRKNRRIVTGLVICPTATISVGRKNKRYIRKLLLDYKYNKLDIKMKHHLSGYLAYILDVEPEFYNRLILKYGGEIVNAALQQTRSIISSR
jgi:RNA-directed DNA polymerase